jgi:acyl-coenzyme A synthetase/AMP-(fatty) acid ligase
MRRVVIATTDPWNWIDKFDDHSIMIVDPNSTESRWDYLIEKSDFSLLITDQGETYRDGADYPEERLFHYTSGTTGDSKFYSFTQYQLDLMTKEIIDWFGITSNDRYFGIMPLHHTHGQCMYWAARAVGCETRFARLGEISSVEDFNPTFLSAIPDIAKIFMRYDLPDLRFVRLGSAAPPDFLYFNMLESFQCPVINLFGVTEMLGPCFAYPLSGPWISGTVGLPINIDYQIDNQSRLWIKGPRLHKDGWYDTGDLAETDHNGYVKILGRSIDRINVKGNQIDPLSIEDQIYQKFPEIKECAVFGKTRLKCVYVGDISEALVHGFLVLLAPYCRPAILVKLDAIPKNTINKISRNYLDSLF